MKKMVFVICFLLLSSSSVFSADELHPTGHNWNSWTTEQKISYLHGFIEGADNTLIIIWAGMVEKEVQRDKLGSIINYSFHGISIRQMLDGLSLFYGDFKNRGIYVVQGIYVVKKQIKGTPSEDIERILLWLRTGGDGGKRDDYLVIRDSQGKIVKIIEFP